VRILPISIWDTSRDADLYSETHLSSPFNGYSDLLQRG
jgi:hypothetical protein